MGWSSYLGLSSSNSSTTNPSPSDPEPSKDGGYIAPDRTSRAHCWEMRDEFFRCLDRHDILDSVKEDEQARKACAPELRAFEGACASSWVAYFKKRRVFEYQKEQTLKRLEGEGVQGMPSSDSGNVAATALKGNR